MNIGKQNLLLAAVVTMIGSGCTTTPQDHQPLQTDTAANAEVADTQLHQPLDAKEEAPASRPSNLSAELLYDILVSAVASQRRQPEVALEALSRATYLSRDKRLNADAIQLAMHVKDYQKAIELARLMLVSEPDNFRVRLALARAQISLSKLVDAAETLMDLAVAQPIGQEAVLQEIANAIARQQPHIAEILKQRFDNAERSAANPQLTLTTALIASRLKQPGQFRALLDKSLTQQPGWEVPAILKITDIASQKPEQLNVWAKEFLRNHPESERFRIQYARLLIDDQDLSRSLEQLEIVLNQNPESPDALYIAAVINMDLQNPDQAEKLFERYIALGSNGDQARLYLAELLRSQQRYEEATPLLRQIQSEQHYLDAQIALAKIIGERHSIDDAIRYLQNIDVYTKEDAIQVVLEQEYLLRDADQIDRALDLLNNALKRWPDHPNLLYNRGLLAAQHNYLDIVERDMRRLIELEPDNAHAYNTLGYTLADQTDRYEEALELIAKALEFLPDDAFILDSMGWVHYRMGNHALALEFLERALSIRQDAEISAHLGEVLWISGQQSRAQEVWEEGIRLYPDNPTLRETMQRFIDKQQHVKAAPPVQIEFQESRLLVPLHTRQAISYN